MFKVCFMTLVDWRRPWCAFDPNRVATLLVSTKGIPLSHPPTHLPVPPPTPPYLFRTKPFTPPFTPSELILPLSLVGQVLGVSICQEGWVDGWVGGWEGVCACVRACMRGWVEMIENSEALDVMQLNTARTKFKFNEYVRDHLSDDPVFFT